MASETPELRFERWRTRGDAAALSDVFDALAPGLLRLAIHLVGDAAAAEDLVQQTFVTAMERAASWDARRPLEPWLQGILANHARDLRKLARRAHDPDFDLEAVLARAEDAPFESASRRELSGELARAVDALEEPYRAAVLLRLRHGMEAADIAHVLGRSPGAVRVQLHRAREMLRKALPVGIASAIVILAESARGLETVRNQVLTEGARLAPAAGIGGGLLGGMIVVKKLVVGALVLLAALTAFLLVSRSNPVEPDRPALAQSRPILKAPPPPDVERSEIASVPDPGPRAVIAPPPAAHRLLGRVLDTPGDKPVAGATVELYASKQLTRDEFERRWASRSQQMYDGWAAPIPIDYEDSTANSLQLAGLEPRRDYSPPEPGELPLVRAITDAEGRFELPSPNADGLLGVRAEGYGERRHPWIERAGEEAGTVRDVYVSRAGRLSARLIDETGAPFERRVKLVLRGAVRFLLAPPSANRREENHFDVWDVETDETGRFSLDIAAQAVFVRSSDPELGVRAYGWALPGGRGCAPRPWFSPGAEPGDLVIVVRPTCVLAVTDAATGTPIERFHLRSERVSGRARNTEIWDGWFTAVGGILRITPEMDGFANVVEREAQDGPWSARLWAPGYRPAEITVDSAWRAQRVDVRLEHGSIAKVSGRVVRAGVPVASTPIVVRPIHSIWQPPIESPNTRWSPFAGTRTNSDGRFEFELEAGRHLATIGVGADQASFPFVAPNADIELDLAARADIRVRVTMQDGSVGAARPIRVSGSEGERIEGETDPKGEFVVARTAPGPHTISASALKVLNGRDVWDVEREVDARVGVETLVEIDLPSDQPRYGRLVLVGATNPERWFVNVRGWSDSRVAVEPDGRIPIDLRTSRSLDFAGPDGFAMMLSVPKDAADGHEFRVLCERRGYAGVLISAADGKPLARVRIFAYLREPPAKGMHTATTDAEGRFELVGLEAAPYRIGFDGDMVADYTIYPDADPALPPRQLDLALPTRRGAEFSGTETTRVVGTLRWQGQSVEGAQVQIAVEKAIPGARLFVTSILTLRADGRYDTLLPRATAFNAWCWQPATGAKETHKWTGSGGAVEERDIDLP